MLPFLWIKRGFNFHDEDVESLSKLLQSMAPSEKCLNIAAHMLALTYLQSLSVQATTKYCTVSIILSRWKGSEIYRKVDTTVRQKLVLNEALSTLD